MRFITSELIQIKFYEFFIMILKDFLFNFFYDDFEN